MFEDEFCVILWVFGLGGHSVIKISGVGEPRVAIYLMSQISLHTSITLSTVELPELPLLGL